MQRPLAWLAPLLLGFTCCNAALAAVPDFPALTGRVVDAANILSEQSRQTLTEMFAAEEAATSNQLVVATVADLQGFAIADFANQLARHWQLGQADKNNGVLLLVAPTDRKVRIEVGYGLEGALTDAQSTLIIKREILPAFRTGDYDVGILSGSKAIIAAIGGEYEAKGTNDAAKGLADMLAPILILSLMVGHFLVVVLKQRRLACVLVGIGAGIWTWIASQLIGTALLAGIFAGGIFWLLSAGGSDGGWGGGSGTGGSLGGGGSFGGGGGFSGGGGSFGGGGASGGW